MNIGKLNVGSGVSYLMPPSWMPPMLHFGRECLEVLLDFNDVAVFSDIPIRTEWLFFVKVHWVFFAQPFEVGHDRVFAE